MIHKRTLRRWSGVLALSLLFLANSMGVFGMKTQKGKTEPGRADIITIDALKRLGALERPAVVFYHDKHTRFRAQVLQPRHPLQLCTDQVSSLLVLSAHFIHIVLVIIECKGRCILNKLRAAKNRHGGKIPQLFSEFDWSYNPTHAPSTHRM